MQKVNILIYLRLALFIISLLVYLPTIGYDFSYDDYSHIHRSKYVNSQHSSLAEIFSVFSQATVPGDLYRPLTILSFKINYLISGLSPWSYHLFNLILNSFVVILIFQLLNLIKLKPVEAFLVSLIFAVHPLHTEAVASIYNRTELLAAFFTLTALICLIKYNLNQKWILLLSGLLSCLLGFLAKESALSIILLLPLCLYMLEELKLEKVSKIIKSLSLLAIPTLAYLLSRYLVLNENFLVSYQYDYFLPENPLLTVARHEAFLPALILLGKYILLLIFPWQQSIDYSLSEVSFYKFFSSPEALGYLLISLLLLTLLVILKKNRMTSFGILWFAFAFCLSWNFPFVIGTIFAERLTYLPSLGIIIFLFFLTKDLLKKNIFLVIYICYLLSLSYLTINRIPVWQDHHTLIEKNMLNQQNNPKLAYIKGWDHKKRAEYQLCSKYLKLAAQNEPGWLPYLEILIRCEYLQENYKSALALSNYLLSQFPYNPNIQASNLLIKEKIAKLELKK